MAGAFEASNELIQAKAQEFQQTHDMLMHAIADLKRDEDSMVAGANWRGGAADAFNAFMQRYYFQADKLVHTAETLIKVGSNYEEHDKDYESKVNAQISSLDLPAV
ncbi:WXG100 family type VII secretion target [Nocardia sp. NPDC004711]